MTQPRLRSDVQPQDRFALEILWRTRLERSLTRYREAAEVFRRLNEQRRLGLSLEPPSEVLLPNALQEEVAALREYRRVLRIFTDLVLEHKLPSPES